ncbi:MAG: iron ABC transporter permease [Nocardioides sp.]|nr:iron ABC transporter permease [Nocardioides sp.]
MRLPGARLGFALVPLAVLAVFFVLPVAGMVARGFVVDGVFDPGAVLEVLGRPRVHRVLLFTVTTAAVGTVLSVLLGVPAAYALHRLRFPGARVLRAVVVIPFVLPTVVVGVAFRQLLAPSGLLGGLGLDGTPVAIVAALVFFNVSVVVRTVGAHWEGLDPRREEAAAALGASPLQVLWTVTLPALRPAIVSAASVVFLFCATAFGVVLTLGGLRYATVETEIYLLTTSFLDLQAAAALSLVQMAAVVVLLALAHRARAGEGPLTRTSRPPRRPRRGDVPALLVLAGVLTLVATPVLTLVARSLRVGDGWGWDHYRALAAGPAETGGALRVPVTTAVENSLRTAVDATVLALVLGVVVAVVTTRPVTGGRRERRWAAALDGVFMLPLGVSAVTLGFGFLITLDRPPLDLRSSPLLVPIAQAMVALPLVVRVLSPVLRSIDDRQRQVARTLGAPPSRVLRDVDLALAWRPLLAATGFAFAVSLGEFGATSFLARGDRPTLPIVVFQLISRPGAENLGMALAASVVLGVLTVSVMALVERLRGSGPGQAGVF